ncbi:MAG: hypothetical protein ACM30D_10460, partial [Hyphomicrobiales bacterium]
AQFMYHNAAGDRLTLFIARIAATGLDVPLHPAYRERLHKLPTSCRRGITTPNVPPPVGSLCLKEHALAGLHNHAFGTLHLPQRPFAQSTAGGKVDASQGAAEPPRYSQHGGGCAASTRQREMGGAGSSCGDCHFGSL